MLIVQPHLTLAECGESGGAAAVPLCAGRYRLAPDGRAEATERRRLEQDLRHGLAQGQFALHYQPRIDLRSGRAVGAEALLRWPHRRRGTVPPAIFVPIAERSGLISEIGAWVLKEACREAVNWPAGTVVSVNVSPRQLAEGRLLVQVAEALAASGLPGDRLELEFGEAGLVDLDLDRLLTLAALRDRGVGLALDDFGTGLISFATLRAAPLTAVKLDRCLLGDLAGVGAEQLVNRAILTAVLALARTLDIVSVAEGVESAPLAEALTALGCDEAQGFLFSHPLPAERLRARLAGEPRPA